ncbi:MAG: hypothetical protein ACUVUC_08420 [Thermoguttaceae bacterium]
MEIASMGNITAPARIDSRRDVQDAEGQQMIDLLSDDLQPPRLRPPSTPSAGRPGPRARDELGGAPPKPPRGRLIAASGLQDNHPQFRKAGAVLGQQFGQDFADRAEFAVSVPFGKGAAAGLMP